MKKKSQKKTSKPRKKPESKTVKTAEKQPEATASNVKVQAGQHAPATTQLAADDSIVGSACPICGQGHIIKGKTAYGCSRWKEGCTFRLPFKQ